MFCFCQFIVDIEAQIKDIQAKKKESQAQEESEKGIGLLESGYFDSELYDGNGAQKSSKYDGYVTSIALNDQSDEEDDDEPVPSKRNTGFGAPAAIFNEMARVSINLLIFSSSFSPSNVFILILE